MTRIQSRFLHIWPWLICDFQVYIKVKRQMQTTEEEKKWFGKQKNRYQFSEDIVALSENALSTAHALNKTQINKFLKMKKVFQLKTQFHSLITHFHNSKTKPFNDVNSIKYFCIKKTISIISKRVESNEMHQFSKYFYFFVSHQ